MGITFRNPCEAWIVYQRRSLCVVDSEIILAADPAAWMAAYNSAHPPTARLMAGLVKNRSGIIAKISAWAGQQNG